MEERMPCCYGGYWGIYAAFIRLPDTYSEIDTKVTKSAL
jgi:hypothetical protein